MNELIVVDFDKTLIPYDSFRKYIYLWLFKYPFRIGKLLVMRYLRLISASYFKERFLKIIMTNSSFEKINHSFAMKLKRDINEGIMVLINKHTNPETCVVILSASPEHYISEVGRLLGFKGIGSHFDGNEFIHLYGDEKLNYLEKHFSKINNQYILSISDSTSDTKLLRMFQNYILLQ